MSTNKRTIVTERIVAAALDLLRREGMPALTQPRVAKAAGLRQSHITYYFPTRSDLVAAVATAVAQQLTAGFEDAFASASPATTASRMAHISTPEQTRLLLALVLETDREPSVRALFRRLTKDIRAEIASGLARHGIAAGPDRVALLHALGIGLAVLDLARAEPASRRETRSTTALALRQWPKRKGKKT